MKKTVDIQVIRTDFLSLTKNLLDFLKFKTNEKQILEFFFKHNTSSIVLLHKTKICIIETMKL